MLLANVAAARATLAAFPAAALLRRHPAPRADAFAPLLAAARAVGVALDVSSSKARMAFSGCRLAPPLCLPAPSLCTVAPLPPAARGRRPPTRPPPTTPTHPSGPGHLPGRGRPPLRPLFQHAAAHPGHALHGARRLLCRRVRRAARAGALRLGRAAVHPLHVPHPPASGGGGAAWLGGRVLVEGGARERPVARAPSCRSP